jgi:hypothetical protein
MSEMSPSVPVSSLVQSLGYVGLRAKDIDD